MMSRDGWADGFGDFEGRVWLNCAHQGALPAVAAAATREAVAWKMAPHQLTTERFTGVPQRLRQAIGRLIGAPPEEISLANSASYGLHLLANGLPLESGDEVLLMAGDFPSNILPWLALAERGVHVRQLKPAGTVLQPDEVAAALGPRTRVLCTSWVHSFSGHTLDIAAIGQLCREHGVWYLVNASQGLGARPLAIGELAVDAMVSVGHKWQCGPYASGFCWMRPSLRESLRLNRCYWLSMQTADDLGRTDRELVPRTDLGARRYDVFATANFFNFTAWTASLEYLLAQGIDAIRDHDQALVDRLLAGLDGDRYRLISPAAGPARSTLVLLSHRRPERNRELHGRLEQAGIDVALRNGCLRVAPHLYNRAEHIDRVLAVLDEAG